jgi:prepilin-type N-terminal cleavage/methylation domain-containing protein
MTRTHAQDGFTLIEVLLAAAVTAMVMTTVGLVFAGSEQARHEVAMLSESTEAGPRILTLLERDLHALWTLNVKGNKVLRGRNLDIAGIDADRIDFLTTTDPIEPVLDASGQPRKPPVCEVGYWLKRNERYPDLLELWRREDPMIDEDLLTGGQFQLVHDRLKSFNVTWYETLGVQAEELHEWDSGQRDELPRRLKIELTIERRLQSENVATGAEVDDFEGIEKKYVRHIVLDARAPEVLKPGVAMVPLLPIRPVEQGGSGPGGPGGPNGPGGPGGPGSGGGNGRQRPPGQGPGRPPGPGRGRNDGATPPRDGGGQGVIDLGGLLRGGNRGGGNLFGGPPSGGGRR